MFKVGDLVTPNPDKFTKEILNHRTLDGKPAKVVQWVGKVFVVQAVFPGPRPTLKIAGETMWIPDFWKSAIPEIFKTINKYGTDTRGDQSSD